MSVSAAECLDSGISIKPRLFHVEFRPLGEDGTLVIAPGGAMFEVACDPVVLGSVLKRCDGSRTLDEVVADTADPDGFREIVEMLMQEGAILPNESASSDLPGAVPEPGKLAATYLTLVADEALHDLVERYPLLSEFAGCGFVPLSGLTQRVSALNGEHQMVVVLKRFFDKELLLEVNQLCEENQIPWAQFHLDRGKGWLGPVIVPGQTADYTDLIDRRMCCTDNEAHFAAEMAPPTYPGGTGLLPSEPEMVWMLSRFFAELERFCGGGSCGLLSTELEADPAKLTIESFSFLPMPHRRIEKDFLSSSPKGAEMLINHRSGVIIRSVPVQHDPSVPKGLVTMQNHVSNIARKYPCANDVIVGGSNFGDRDTAYYSSVGEAIERYCGNYIPGETLRKATYNQIVRGGDYALDPESLILFSESMYNTNGCPMVRFTRDLEVLWVKGRSLTKNRAAWLPVSVVYVNWHTALKEEPITNYYWFPGIAAGQNMEHALVSGLEEIVERDITMIWWMNRQPLLSMVTTPELDALWDPSSRAAGQRPWLIHLDNEFGIPVMAGVLENTKEGFFNIGFGCRPDPIEAARKAWTEALTLQEGSRDMDDPNGLLRTSVEEWGLIDVPYKPWRADRRYLEDYRPDFRDVSDLLQQQQVYLDPRALERVRAWVDTPRTRHFKDIPSLPDRSLATIQERIESRGFEIFYKDITTPDVDLTGLKAARILVPGMVPNTSAAFPPLGGSRLRQLPVKLGWREQPLDEADLNYAPLPHA